MIWFIIFIVVLVVVAITRFHLRGEDLTPYDQPDGEQFSSSAASEQVFQEVMASLGVGMAEMQKAPRKQRLGLMREFLDNMSEGLDLPAKVTPVDAGGVDAEWVVAPGADINRRVLYLHGGAFVMGSPRSHRNVTSRFSEIAGAAVLAVDYRLMPENPRKAGIEDCRNAYQWLLENGPEGRAPVETLFVAGDSAGGNLTLSVIAWARDAGVRQADAAVALSPTLDTTMSSPSLTNNVDSDLMLGDMFRGLKKIPRPLLWWFGWIHTRVSPSNPVVSPVFGDLSGLPPTLVHASSTEVLFDDAKRYVNRAAAAGTPARLQSWADMPHVWHMFYPQLDEANQAWEEIRKFIAEVDQSVSSTPGSS